MRLHRLTLTILVLALAAAPAWAQKPIDRGIGLEMAADEGRWAAVKGELQGDGTFFADEIELIALGDAEGTEIMEVRGIISNINVQRRTLRVMNYSVVWEEKARIRDADKNKISAKELKNNVGATVEGHFKDGKFVANDIRQRSGKIKNGKLIYKQEIIGPIKVIDLEAGLIRVIDTDVRLVQNCQFFELPMQVKSAGE